MHCGARANVLPPTHSDELYMQWLESMLRLANALVNFQACIQIMQAMDISSYEVLNPEVKEINQSLEIIRNDDANNL